MLRGVVPRGFVSCSVGFDTPRDASVCKGLRGVVPYLTCYTNVYRVQCESRKAESQAETTDLRVLDRLQSVSPVVCKINSVTDIPATGR